MQRPKLPHHRFAKHAVGAPAQHAAAYKRLAQPAAAASPCPLGIAAADHQSHTAETQGNAKHFQRTHAFTVKKVGDKGHDRRVQRHNQRRARSADVLQPAEKEKAIRKYPAKSQQGHYQGLPRRHAAKALAGNHKKQTQRCRGQQKPQAR